MLEKLLVKRDRNKQVYSCMSKCNQMVKTALKKIKRGHVIKRGRQGNGVRKGQSRRSQTFLPPTNMPVLQPFMGPW